MNYVSDIIEFCKEREDQDEYIRHLELSLAGSANIDFTFLQNNVIGLDMHIRQLELILTGGSNIDLIFLHNNIYGTVLTHAIECGFDQIVRYALDKGASITTEIQSNSGQIFKFRNVIEISIRKVRRISLCAMTVILEETLHCITLYPRILSHMILMVLTSIFIMMMVSKNYSSWMEVILLVHT